MSLGNSPLPRVSPDVVWTTVADGAVLLSTDRELYYGANVVAAFVWEQLSQLSGATLEDLCAAVESRFPDAAAPRIREDVVELIEDFVQNGLLASPLEPTG